MEEVESLHLPPGYDADALLAVLRDQYRQSLGGDEGDKINTDRARSMDYYKGEHSGHVAQDMPVMSENRSKVVTTEVADFVETALPDLLEVFSTSEDFLSFEAFDEEDESQAEQETDYVQHVFMHENDGWRILYDAFKNALLAKVGVFRWYWEPEPVVEDHVVEAHDGQIEEIEALGNKIIESEPMGDGLNRLTIQKTLSSGRLVVQSINPEDFVISPNATSIQDADYCAVRKITTVQSLIADGFDEETINQLQEHRRDESTDYARDANEENSEGEQGASGAFKLVEIREHYIRLNDDDGEPQLYLVVTGKDESLILNIEERSHIELSMICPFPVPGRAIGQSAADKIVPLQRWSTAITRLCNDGFAFSLHQRPVVDTTKIDAKHTLSDLVNNEPGRPIIAKSVDAVKMITNNVDTARFLSYLEYIQTVVEKRTGFVRNAQGLNPDTLHDTKGGAEMLIGAAQKRIRMMARIFAETGLRDLFLGIHETLRSNSTIEHTIRLRGDWVPINPSDWRQRKRMRINVGVGSGGREQDLLAVRELRGVIESVISLQGGLNGPVIGVKQLMAFIDHYADKLGIRGAERFFFTSDEAEQINSQQPEDDGGVAQAQAELQMKQQEFMAKMSLEQQKAYLKAETDRMKSEIEAKLKVRQQDMEAELRMRDAQNANLQDVRFGGAVG